MIIKYFLIVIGYILFFLGLVYIYYPGLILKINSIIKRYLFNDSFVMFHRKKIGLLYILISIIMIYYGIIFFKSETSYKIYQAYKNYCYGKYSKTEKICLEILNVEPNNIKAIEQLALVYFVMGDYKKAKIYCKKFLSKQPENVKIQKILEKCLK